MSRQRKAAPAPAPAELGFRMPAEWESHAATWIAWPHQRSDWPGKFAPIPWVYGEVVRHIAAGERVRILVDDESVEWRARALLRRVGVDLARIDFYRVRTDRAWTRDYCPQFVRDRAGKVELVNFQFNAWAKYRSWALDDAVTDQLAKLLKRRQWKVTAPDAHAKARRVVLEGGSIDVNGRGTLLTTEECLLSPVQARNPWLTREAIEAVLGAMLGVRKVLWLGDGIAGDDTHGHVDDLARFVDEQTVVVASEDDPRDPNHAKLVDARRRLARMTNESGRPLRVVPLPMPAPLFLDGRRLPASYANFYIANAAVLVPTFNDANDRRALHTLAELFPTRRVIGIHAVDLVWGLGTLHCMTQQEPA